MKASISIQEHDSGWKDLVKQVRELKASAGAHVRVGFVSSDSDQPHEASPKAGLTVAEIGLVHEFGAPSRGIPERSFLRSTLAANTAKYVSELATRLRSVLATKKDLKTVFEIVGQMASADVKATIRAGLQPALAPSTLKIRNKHVKADAQGKLRYRGARYSKANVSHKPLYDTGQLMRAITYLVKLGRSR